MPGRPARSAFRRFAGFSSLDALLAMVVLSLAGYIALSEIRKFQHRAQRDRFVGELRSLAAAFETFRAQRGEWPPATNPEARIPRGMESALATTAWLAGPPFGGRYDWFPPAPAKTAGKATGKPAEGGTIAVTGFSTGPTFTLSEADLRYLDAQLDDGDLRTGRFRAGFNGWPVYTVNPRH